MTTNTDIQASERQVFQLVQAGSDWYAATSDGLFVSTDQGRHWQLAYASLGANEALATLAVAVATPASGPAPLFAGLSGELLHSVDAGATWQVASRPSPAPVFTALAVSPVFASDGLLFAGTLQDGVLLYSGGGRTWNVWNFGLLDARVLALAVSPNFASDQLVFAATQSGLFRSESGGRSWQEAALPGGYNAILSLAVSPAFASDRTVYAGSETHGLLVSHDAGQTWQQCAALPEPINTIIAASQQNILVLHGERPLVSHDAGTSWHPLAGEPQATAVLAPEGLAAGAPLVLATLEGTIEQAMCV